MFTSEEFKDYLAKKNISPTCLCCGNNEWNAFAGTASSSAGTDDDANHIPVNTLGLVAMTTNQEGNIGYTRDGGIAIAFITCNQCGHIIPFHYHFVSTYYNFLKNKENVKGGEVNE
jgi:RNase P subunit RPR2